MSTFERLAARRRELEAALAGLEASIAATRAYVREAPGIPAPGHPGRLTPAPERGRPAPAAVGAAHRLRDELVRRDLLRAELRLLDLGRPRVDRCERAALAWLNGLERAEQLVAELVRLPPGRPPGLPPGSGLPPGRPPGRPPGLPPGRPQRPDLLLLRVARAILRFRDTRPARRLTALAELRAVRGVTDALLADLRHTGCTRLPAPEPGRPDPAVRVLLPLRIETRFDPGRLRLRVIPDDPWLAYHDPRASAAELDALERAVALMATAPDPQLVFAELAGQVGGARAVWLVRTFVATSAAGTSSVQRPPEEDLRTEPAFPRVVGFPDELDVWLGRGGAAPARVLTLSVDHDRLRLDLPDRSAGERRWWEDWDEAVAAGVAGELELEGDPGDIDVLLVTGLSGAEPSELFTLHRDAGSLGLLAPGTPTNTVDGAPAGSLARDPAAWWEVLQGTAGDGARRVSRALTGDPDLLGGLPGDEDPQHLLGPALVAGLWPALWGFAGDDVWGVVPGTGRAAAWAPHALAPEGPFPTLRVGAQPYGLLPVTSLRRWRPAEGDPEVEAGLPEPLEVLRRAWRQAAEARGTVAGADTERLLDLLGHVPTAPGYRHRLAFPLELWWLSLLLVGLRTDWRDLDAAWFGFTPLSKELGLTASARRYAARSRSRRLTLPLVRPEAMPEGRRVGEILELLVDEALTRPGVFAVPERLDHLHDWSLDSLLLRLAVRALQVALGDVRRAALGHEPPEPEPLGRRGGEPGLLERRIAEVDPSDLEPGEPGSAPLHRVVGGLRVLAGMDEARLERGLRATLDCAVHRIDPWIAGLPTRRLDDLLEQDAAMATGVFGWVDAPRPGAPGPTPAGLVHAPSAAQGLTAAVLRDRAVRDPEPRWHLDLTSRSVRTAETIAGQVRAGAHLGEALGREVERIAGSPAAVKVLRDRFPLRTEHAGRRTCDGQAVLDADPDDLGLGAGALAALDELRAGLDAYGDLLVAEAVHHVTQGRAESAGGAMDAAAGLGRPPQLDVLRTAREGRSVATTALLLLPVVTDPPPPAEALERAERSPAALADPAAASFLTAQLGAAAAWRWEVADAAAGATTAVTLEALGLQPADALALPVADLERLVLDAGAAALATARGAVTLAGADGSRLYERAAALAGLLGRSPAGPDAVARVPDVAAHGAGAAAVGADLAARFAAVRATGEELASLLEGELALTAGGQVGGADPARLVRLVVAARRWGVAPDPAAAVAAGTNGAGPPDALVATAARAHALLAARLAAGPDLSTAADLPQPELVEALAALASPTGQLAVLARLAASELPVLQRADGGPGVPALDAAWLSVAAAVREPLARLELHQLTAGTALGAGPALRPWSSKPADPWQQDPAGEERLVLAWTAAPLDLATVPASGSVAAAVLDRFTETVPAEPQTTQGVFGFDAPGARAPQAILLAVPPDLEAPWDAETLRDVVLETRELARARMARPADLREVARGVLPTALLPASGRLAVNVDPPER